jgi:ABC-type antimicrobial peptide transport system permease subunit
MNAVTHGSNMTITAPLRDQMSAAELVIIFTNQGFSTIMVFLGIISMQLIYSLMMSDIEDKTYEFGMLRALGFSKSNIIITISYQAVMFIIPGLSSGIIMAWILNYMMRH